MTDEERKNRNPAVEYSEFKVADCPELHICDLELHKVYILESARIVSLNYLGKLHTFHLVTFDAIVVHHFHGPRANFHCYLMGMPDGTLQDGDGHKITLRRFNGPDA